MNKSSFVRAGMLAMLVATAVFAQDPGPAPGPKGNESGPLRGPRIETPIADNSLKLEPATAEVGQDVQVSWAYSNPGFSKAEVRLLVDGKVVHSAPATGNSATITLSPSYFEASPIQANTPSTVQVMVVPFDPAGMTVQADEQGHRAQLTVRAANTDPVISSLAAPNEIIGNQPLTVTAEVTDPNGDNVDVMIELQSDGTWLAMGSPVEVSGSGPVSITVPTAAVSAPVENTYRLVADDHRSDGRNLPSMVFKVKFLPPGSTPTPAGPTAAVPPGAPEAPEAPAAPGGGDPTGPMAGDAPAAPDTELPPADTAMVDSGMPAFTQTPIMSPRSGAVIGGTSVAIRWDAEGEDTKLLIRLRDAADPEAPPVAEVESSNRRALIRTPGVRERMDYVLEVALLNGHGQTEFQATPLTLMPMPAGVRYVPDEVRFSQPVTVTRPTRGRAVADADGYRNPRNRRGAVQYDLSEDEHGNLVVRRKP